MKTTISLNDFVNCEALTISLNDFVNCEALTNAFSYDGLVAMFDYIEDYEQSCGRELEFDPIALRCEFSQYTTIVEAYGNYEDDGEDLTELEMIEWLQDRTRVIEFETGVILQDF
jgi:hypothetical protein